ncbi:MAG: TonB-dependent receptor [Gemmatimonadota bacterium]|nr:TonB-dependent receptor [Gemmatimonadota bacterium]
MNEQTKTVPAVAASQARPATVPSVRRLGPASVIAFVGLAIPASGLAQAPSDSAESKSPPDATATLRGIVASRVDGLEISNAQVLVPELDRGVRTDDEGAFELAGLPPGEYDVHVRYLGYATNESPIRLEAGRVSRVTFLLERDVLEVAELVVEVPRPPPPPADWMRAFRQRRAEGFGHFLDRGDIEEKRVRRASDLFRQIPGVYVSPAGFEGSGILLRRGARQCQPALWVDGVLTGRYPIDDLHPDDIEGIEVYRRASQTPLQFKRGTCGSILIWTRAGGGAGGP